MDELKLEALKNMIPEELEGKEAMLLIYVKGRHVDMTGVGNAGLEIVGALHAMVYCAKACEVELEDVLDAVRAAWNETQ